MMADEPSVEAGDTASTVMLSPCVGGLLRTWDGSNDAHLWSVPDAASFSQGRGADCWAVHCARKAGLSSPDSWCQIARP